MSNPFYRCTRVRNRNRNEPADEAVVFKGQTYTWCGCGVSGHAYLSEPNGNPRRMLKIIPTEEDSDVAPFLNEVDCQKKAAAHELGPAVYDSGVKVPLQDPQGPFEFLTPESHFCQFAVVNFILMDYYDKNDGWKQLPAYSLDSHRVGIIKLLDDLVNRAEVINLMDPRSHFFYHPIHGYRMIDYGAAVPVLDKSTFHNKSNRNIQALVKEREQEINRKLTDILDFPVSITIKWKKNSIHGKARKPRTFQRSSPYSMRASRKPLPGHNNQRGGRKTRRVKRSRA
jgi:hypothetical protein